MDSKELGQIKLNLKVLSQLRPYERLSTIDNRVVVDRPSFFQGLRRWFRGEHRDLNMEVIEQLVRRAILYMTNTNNSELAHILALELGKAMEGLHNLQTTYENDSLSVAKLRLLLDEIERSVSVAVAGPETPPAPFRLIM